MMSKFNDSDIVYTLQNSGRGMLVLFLSFPNKIIPCSHKKISCSLKIIFSSDNLLSCRTRCMVHTRNYLV